MAILVTGKNKAISGLKKGIENYIDKAGNATMKAALKAEAFVKRKTPVRTGNLRSSINTQLSKKKTDQAEAIVGTNVSYAPHVEFGTKKMKAKAMFRKTIDENGKDISDTFKKHLKK